MLRARALLAVFRGDVESARSHAQAWVELARASGDPDELARALLVLASSLTLAEPDAATATLDEAVRVARDAGLASALSIGLPFLAGMLPIEESERALALLDEAIEVGTRLGDRYLRLRRDRTKGDSRSSAATGEQPCTRPWSGSSANSNSGTSEA